MITRKKDYTLDEMLEIWNSPYSDDPVPDYNKIFPFYHPNCRFQDCVQSFEGIEKFKEMCLRLMKNYSETRMVVHGAAKNGNVYFVQWSMLMRAKIMPKKAPLSSMNGATRLDVDENGLITSQRDYYDIWGDIIDNIPGVNKVYRWFMRTVLG